MDDEVKVKEESKAGDHLLQKAVDDQNADSEKRQEEKKKEASIRDTTGTGFEVLTIGGREWKFSAVPIGRIPDLLEEINKLDTMDNAASAFNPETINAMARVFLMGVKTHHPDMTLEDVKNIFTLGAFPRVLKVVLDLNDFFEGMGEVEAMRSGASKTARKLSRMRDR